MYLILISFTFLIGIYYVFKILSEGSINGSINKSLNLTCQRLRD